MNMKYIGIGLLIGFIVLIASGYRGGAKNATGNYIKVRKNAGKSSGEARPSPLMQMIEYNKAHK